MFFRRWHMQIRRNGCPGGSTNTCLKTCFWRFKGVSRFLGLGAQVYDSCEGIASDTLFCSALGSDRSGGIQKVLGGLPPLKTARIPPLKTCVGREHLGRGAYQCGAY